jgi:copper chaperone NosL
VRSVRVIVAGLAVLAVAALVFTLIVRGRPLPDQPVPIVWNREPCAHCRMLVGEPAFAAQLVTRGGDVLAFDDPGCLFHYLEEQRPDVHRMWFHDSTAERWLTPEEVGFVRGAQTPMNYGLAAVPVATPGALALDAARRRDP